MSFQEEPESQIDFPLHQYTNERDSPPPLDYDTHGHAHHEPSPARNNDEPGSDDTVPGSDTASISSPVSRHEVLKSQVEETQFVPVEPDTQPSVDYDISPITRRALDNTESSSASLPPPVMVMPLLERRDAPVLSDSPEFRFGKPPKQNSIKLTRPLPGPNRPRRKEIANGEMLMPPKGNLATTDSVGPSPIIGTPASRGGPPKDTFAFQEQIDSILPAIQTELPHLPHQETAQNGEGADIGVPKSNSQTTESVSVTRSRADEASPRSSKRPFKEAGGLLNATMHTQLLATFKSHSIANQHSLSPNQSRRQAKSKSPPFVEAALSSNLRPNATGIPTTAMTLESALCASNSPVVPMTAEIQSPKPSRSKSRSAAEPIRTDDVQESLIQRSDLNQPGNAVQTLPDVEVHEKIEHRDTVRPAFSDRDLPEPRHVVCDLPTNHRPRSRNSNADSYTSRHGTSKRPPGRPLAEHQFRPHDIRGNHDLHGTRDSRVSKRGLSRAKTALLMQENGRIPIGGSEPFDLAEMFHMAAVMATAEREEREQVVAKARLQEVQIVDLSKENAALQNEIEILSKENQELFDKHAELRMRCERYKSHMNEVTKTQKELRAAGENLSQRKFDALKETAKQMDSEILKAKALASEELRAILKEARLKLNQQDKMIELLNCDINNRLLDLQRERGLKEILQKQLDNREKQQEELKAVLFNHQQSTVAILSGHEDMLKDVLSGGADSALRLNECRALIKSLDEREPKPIPGLIELNELVVALSTSVGEKFKAAEDSSFQVRDASVEVLAELQTRLELLSEDQSAQRQLNASITDLREENAKLKERIENRETEFSGAEKQFNKIKQELQQCQAQLAVTINDLNKALAVSRDDPLLRTQLQDLQTSYSIAKVQMECSASETEKVRADLHEQEKLKMLAQQEISKLQNKLRQSEAKVSAFDIQKEAYVRQLKDESNVLRLQMERDFQARLAEDEARHSGIVSGLRRQITEADSKITHTQRKLNDMEKMNSNKEGEKERISKQVSELATELGSLQDKARLMEQNRDQTGDELRISQEQLIQYMDKAAGWSARAEENALEFAKRCKEIDNEFKKSEEVVEAEIDRLGALVLMLQKKNEDSDIVNTNVACYLRSKGLLELGLTFTEWAVRLPGEHSQQEANLEPCNVLALSPESSTHGSRNNVRISTVSSSNKQTPMVVLDDTSAQLTGEYISCAPNSSYVLLDEDYGGRLPDNNNPLLSSYSRSSSKSMSWDTSKHENHLSTRSVELTSASRALSTVSQPFPATEATRRSCLPPGGYVGGPNVCPSGIKKLGGTARTIIPDSQEELTQEQIPTFTRPTRRVAGRRHSTPHLRGGNRTVTRTEFTEYSIRTSEMYDDTPTVQYDVKSSVRFGDPATDLQSVDSDVESSGLSDPPDNMENVDFTEYLNDSDGNDHKDPEVLRISNKKAHAESKTSHPTPSPKPNSNRVRTRPHVQTKEIKLPKSILKRTNTTMQNDTSADIHSSGKPLKNAQPSKVQGIHGGSAAERRLSRTSSGTNGIGGATYGSSYNRVVSGNRTLQNSSYFQAPDVPPQIKGPSAADIFAISSSPAMGQPQRNSKKRALSGLRFSDSKRPAKLQRSARH